MSETYIKAVLGKDASIQDCLNLVKELEKTNLIKSVDIKSDLNKYPNNSPIFFTPAVKVWKKENLDKEELIGDLEMIGGMVCETMDLIGDLWERLQEFDRDFDFDCIQQAEYILEDVKDVEINFNNIPRVLKKFKEKLERGIE